MLPRKEDCRSMSKLQGKGKICKICQVCGVEFKVFPGAVKDRPCTTCSLKCSGKLGRLRRKGRDIICVGCGATRYWPRTKNPKSRYCRACYNRIIGPGVGRRRVNVNCVICGKELSRSPSRIYDRVACDNECSSELVRRRATQKYTATVLNLMLTWVGERCAYEGCGELKGRSMWNLCF